MRRCARCVYDETIPAITFDENGVCQYCHMHDSLEVEYPMGEEGARRLAAIAGEIRQAGRGKRYDVIVGVSGGCDSSYMLYKAKALGLRPLAVHFDNTWDSTIAVQNIHNMLKKLDVDLHTYVVDNEEYDDIYRSFLQAGVADIEAPTDIGLAVTLYRACEEYGVKYMLEGHSFRSEGISPLGWLYMDGKYIESVQKAYGTRPLKTFPNLELFSFIKWTAFSGIRKIRPLYYMDYHKEETKKFLTAELGWEWYGGHHLENRFTAFFHSYFFPQRWGYDGRLLGLAALVRSGQVTRDEALAEIAEPQPYDRELIEFVKKRLGYSDEEFERLMALPKRTYREFTTYKKTFERMRPFFYMLYRMHRVPKSFYLKYTSPDPLPAALQAPAAVALPLVAEETRGS
ncbi:MAG TPA: N-acetyl sugar amidotransferase [Thermoanaerobaculia bacterium]|nr:N-acetyl sugar amidotransferase [Thermoanaerobaculia bacterium]